MTREEEIRQAAEKNATERAGYLVQGIANAAFYDGAKWADEHPKNPWRDAKKELPEKINKFYSDFVFVAYSVNGEFRFGIDRYDFAREEFGSHVHAEYWMPIPELKEKQL